MTVRGEAVRVVRFLHARHDRPGTHPSPQAYDGSESPHLARKPNYDFEKRKKEMDRKAKKDAKREGRRQRRDEAAADVGSPPDGLGESEPHRPPTPADR